MEQRDLGHTGLRVSALGFGCGSIGGLMVRGDPADQRRAVARALDAGITYFDTAAQYGDAIDRVYMRADSLVGTLLQRCHDGRTTLLVCSERFHPCCAGT